MEQRKCRYEGCRAWPKRGTEWCNAHPDGGKRTGPPPGPHPGAGGKPGNQNGRKHGKYARYQPVDAIRRALDLPPGDLRLEIAVMRSVIGELLGGSLDAPELVGGLEKATGALTRLLKTQRLLDQGARETVDDVMAVVVRDLNQVEGGA